MPRVLITVPCLTLPGGVANYYRILRPYLDSRHVFIEVGRRPGERGVLAAASRLVKDFRRLHAELTSNDYDVVHINPSLGLSSVLRDGVSLLISKSQGKKVIVFFRGWDTAFEGTIRRRVGWLFRAVYDRASAVLVLSAEFERSLRMMRFEAPISIETTVVDEAVLALSLDRQAAGVDVKKCNILYVSRLERGKGLLLAVKAFGLLRERNPTVTLTVAGEGEERVLAEEFVNSEKISGVSFVGHVDAAEKCRVFREADVFFFPTCFGEGMPNCVLEAMAYGLPVVTRPVGGLGDFFENGQMGFATDSRDPAEFANLLGRLADDGLLRRQIGQYNREYSRTRFAAPVVAGRLLKVYYDVARSAGTR